jgi:hypothetical protein
VFLSPYFFKRIDKERIYHKTDAGLLAVLICWCILIRKAGKYCVCVLLANLPCLPAIQMRLILKSIVAVRGKIVRLSGNIS